MNRTAFMLPLLALCALAAPARAADDEKVPYWASIDAEVANMRVGPDESYRIDWVYRRMHLPVKVLRREGPWRQIEDPDGDKGWMRDLLLSRQRSAIVKGGELVEMHAQGSESSRLLWRLEPGVVGLLGDCQTGWCQFDADGHKGFVAENQLWGTGEP
ncbi:SH3-like domain-containing protein [Novosphingobium sp. CF614]|uniref:SH3 domain-containing protein n=1 Tax=Novosphingobium sp. CF614 TaxID=1884364 RepID=UPI0008EA2240|nr:SH3 domain-containing protein [Novosphingobium sp. CF614]SFG24944.1 SH3-like domain-containing protein [Novosphingobium sp. CF614]